jgi:hypothetical protein
MSKVTIFVDDDKFRESLRNADREMQKLSQKMAEYYATRMDEMMMEEKLPQELETKVYAKCSNCGAPLLVSYNGGSVVQINHIYNE